MTRCDYCGKSIDGVPFKCHRCTGYYCSKHHLPEDHNCPGLEKEKSKNQEKWKKAFAETFSGKKHLKSSNYRKKKRDNSYRRKRSPFAKLKYFFIYKAKDFGDWLKDREHRKYNFGRRFNYLLGILIPLAISIVAYAIFYSNAPKLNDVNLWIIKLGGVLILVSVFFIIKYGIKFIKELINILKRQKNWLKYLIIILLLFLLWQAYTNKETVLNPVFDIYNQTNFSLFIPIGGLNLSSDGSSGNNSNSIFNKIDTFILGPEIDDTWVHNFMSIVNTERTNKGLHQMRESTQLNNIATKRFNKMMESPFISHYGAEAYNVGEVVFYPEGFTEQDYVEDIKVTAYLHWDLLMDPMFSHYGYHIEEGPTLSVYEPCSVTEIPGPNIDEKEFFRQRGCQTATQDSMWLVIDMT